MNRQAETASGEANGSPAQAGGAQPLSQSGVSDWQERVSSSIDHFQELMKCFICLTKVKDPVLCPHCGKFACENCFRDWVTGRRAECPICRRALAVSQMVKVRFLNEINKIVDVLGRQHARPPEPEPAETCQAHAIKMTYFCAPCGTAICSDCLVFEEAHKGHKVERVKAVYDRKVEAVNAELAALRGRVGELQEYSRALAGRAETLKRLRDEKFDELINSYRLMKTNLENEFGSRSLKLAEEKKRVDAAAEAHEQLHAEVLAHLKAGSQMALIARTPELLSALAKTNQQPPLTPLPASLVSDFGGANVVRPATGTFVLRPFSLHRANNEIVFSPPFAFDGTSWRIKVYPNGSGIYKGMYLSLFVEMVRGWENGGSYYYKVALVRPDNEARNIERDYSSEFENSICWGYNRFCKLEDLETQGFWDRANDQITLRYVVHAANQVQKIRDQEAYIGQLEEQLRAARAAGDLDAVRAAVQDSLDKDDRPPAPEQKEAGEPPKDSSPAPLNDNSPAEPPLSPAKSSSPSADSDEEKDAAVLRALAGRKKRVSSSKL